LNKDQKAEVIAEIASQLADSPAVYAVDYRGLSVTQAAELRRSLRENETSFRVVKNTLTLRAADQAGVEAIKPLVEDGPTALAFVLGDPALAAKVLDTFARQSQVMQLKGGVLDGQPIDTDQLRALARLPGRDQLNAQLAGVVASPLTTLVRGLGSLLSGLAIALGQVQEQRAAEAPARTEPAPEPEAEAEAEAEAEPQPEAEAEDRPEDSEQQPEESEESEESETEKEAE
jgi:large subunit ribosomal protein L10